ncbi:putative o-methyltransferase b [Diaporthe ampelina]|uniref:Putative o-methyltransferase b n=1 Tax=Diaporthe ampelina TaxID=1214573 RepID=A0A0G2FBB1_9PEZI|nr:putative o-methyltransferase b [Diaporthe ampelina]
MVQGMRSLSSGGLAATAYPFGSELEKLDIKDGDVAVVDVAGGQGHIMGEVRKQNPGLKGRIVVQDLDSVLDAAPDGPPEGVEFMSHDMFKPQPITTAHVYYLRHIIHDWDDGSVAAILKQLTTIMKARPRTKLLLADLVLPTTNVGMQEAVRDFTMFRLGGMERTEAQWRQLLARNGLDIKRIWRGTEPEACIECTWTGRGGDCEAVFQADA